MRAHAQVVRALMKHNRASEAARLVAEMRAAGYVPGLGIYRAVLCAPAMPLRGSLRLLEQLAGAEGGCGGDVALYEAAAELYARWGKREMAQEMERMGTRLQEAAAGT
jgi:pentatricopeptide repeat protein